MPKGLKTPFQIGHDVIYGLKVTELDGRTGAVRVVMCRFCLTFGREVKPGQKRKRTINLQVFKLTFRSDAYKQHHSSAHPEKWGDFESLNVEDRKTFLDDAKNHANPLMANLDSEGALSLKFNRDIIEVIISDLLFDPDIGHRIQLAIRDLNFSSPFTTKMLACSKANTMKSKI